MRQVARYVAGEFSQTIQPRNERQVKVLYIVTAYPRHESDVITPWLVETIRRLRPHGVDVEVLAPAYRGSTRHRADGVVVHRFRYAPTRWETLTHDQTTPDRIRERPWFAALVPGYVAAGAVAAARLARTGAFDLVHAFWPLPHGVLGLAAKRAGGIPLVSTFFGVELTWMEKDFPLLAPLLRQVVRRSDAVTAISSYTANRLRRLVPGSDPIVIPFGAAVEPATAAHRATRSSAAAGFELLFVGRLVERKGIHVLLEAFATLPRDPAVSLRIVGDGPERASLQAQAERLGLAGRVRFDGYVAEHALADRFAECDALVLPAVIDAKGDTEGLGVVLLEAMVHGKPVIASRAGGIVDIVRDGYNGLLVPPGEAMPLAAAIRALSADSGFTLRLGEQARTDIEARFGWSIITHRLSELYRKLVENSL